MGAPAHQSIEAIVQTSVSEDLRNLERIPAYLQCSGIYNISRIYNIFKKELYRSNHAHVYIYIYTIGRSLGSDSALLSGTQFYCRATSVCMPLLPCNPLGSKLAIEFSRSQALMKASLKKLGGAQQGRTPVPATYCSNCRTPLKKVKLVIYGEKHGRR